MWLVTLVNIALLRANPQDLPTSTALTLLAVLGYYAADIVSALMTIAFVPALQAAALDTLLLLALTQTVLNLRHQGARMRQTLTALAGSGALITIVTVAVTAAVSGFLPEETAATVVWTLSIMWMFAIYGHILRHAFDVSYAAGILAAGTYFFLSLLVTAPFLLSPDR